MSAHDVPQNIVYTHPSITALSGYVRASLAGNVADLEDEYAVHVSRMNALLDRYSADFPAPRWLPALLGEDGRTAGEVVLITGTTGVLGSHLLSQLLADPNVERVYALNRANGARQGSEAVLERQRASFEALGLDDGALDGDKASFHAADLTEEDLGLEHTLVDEASAFGWYGKYYSSTLQIRNSVATIIHCGGC